MGTRAIYGFKYKDEYKITYQPFDGYLSATGLFMLRFINETQTDTMKYLYNNISLINPNEKISMVEKILMSKYYSSTAAGGDTNFSLLFHSLGDLNQYKQGLKLMLNFNDYLFDSSKGDAQYAYIINIDTECLEIHYLKNEYTPNNPKVYYKSKYSKYYLISVIPFSFIREIKFTDLDKIADMVDDYLTYIFDQNPDMIEYESILNHILLDIKNNPILDFFILNNKNYEVN